MATKFKKLASKIQSKSKVSKKEADAITASIGRKKYGKKKFAEMSARGRRNKK